MPILFKRLLAPTKRPQGTETDERMQVRDIGRRFVLHQYQHQTCNRDPRIMVQTAQTQAPYRLPGTANTAWNSTLNGK